MVFVGIILSIIFDGCHELITVVIVIDRLVPIRVTTEIALPANTYFYTNEHDAIVKRGKRGKWFILSIHERGGIDRLNLRDNGGKNHMVQLNHIRH